MSNYSNKDIIVAFRGINNKIDELWCFVKECCQKVPMNIGTGIGLYKRFYNKKWEFKSIIAGNNIIITNNDNDITINATGVTCQDIDDCLGISALGDPSKYLNEQGNWQTIDLPPDAWSLIGNIGTANSGKLGTLDNSEFNIVINNSNEVLFRTDHNVQVLTNLCISANNTVGTNSGSDNLIVGGLNFTTTSSKTTIIGNNNDINSSSNSLIVGESSLVNVCNNSFIAGLENIIGGVDNSFGFGEKLQIQSSNTFSISLSNVGALISQPNSFVVMNGNSGFGTTTPSSTLDIVGTFQYVDGTQGNSKILTSDALGNASWQTPTFGFGSVTSVDMSVPTGLSISGNPITTSGTLALSLTPGYVIPTTTQETNWNTAYTNRITSLTTTGNSGASTLISNTLNVPAYTIDGLLPSQTSNSGKYLTTDGTNASWATVSATTRLDQMLAATATNTIDNANNAQVWNWGSLTTQTALKIASSSITTGSLLELSSTSTAITTNTGLLNVSYSGTPSTAAQTTVAINGNNIAAGNTNQIRIGVRGNAGGGTLFAGGGTGYGGYFTSTVVGNNNYGVYGAATGGNNTISAGGYFVGTGSNAVNAGVYAISYGASTTTPFYGVYGRSYASGSGTTSYGGYFLANGAAQSTVTNIGCYVSATGGNTNYGLIVAAGNTGIGTTTPTSTVQINGSFAAGYVAKTANYTLTSSDRLVNCTANSFTITLPTAVGITGREYIIKNTGTATTITIASTSSQTIDGLVPSTYNVTTLTPLRVMSDGANWITY